MQYKVGKEEFDLLSPAIAESEATNTPVKFEGKVVHTPKSMRTASSLKSNPFFGSKKSSKSDFEIGEDIFRDNGGSVDFESFSRTIRKSNPNITTSEVRSIHGDLSKQGWRFVKNGSKSGKPVVKKTSKPRTYTVLKGDKKLYEGTDFNKASDIMVKSESGVRMLRDGVEISARMPAGSRSVVRNGMSMTRSMPDGSKRDAYSVNCGNKSYHTEDLDDAKKKFKSWCKTGDCTLHHGRKLLDSNFEQPAPKPLGLFLHVPSYRPQVKKNGSGFTATHKKILKDYIEASGKACEYDSLPSTVRSKLKAAGYPETLESDVDRFLMDNNNPHSKPSKLFGNPKTAGKSTTVKSNPKISESKKEFIKALRSDLDRDYDATREALKPLYHSVVNDKPVTKEMMTNLHNAVKSDMKFLSEHGFTSNGHRNGYDLFKKVEKFAKPVKKQVSIGSVVKKPLSANPKEDRCLVVVGNIGTVYSGSNLDDAARCYAEYVKLSKLPRGHASGEDVTMFCAGEEYKSYNAPEQSMERNPKKETYTVIVGNVGQVYSGSNRAEATKEYNDYVKASKSNRGRAGGEDVSLLVGREIERSHSGSASLVGNGKSSARGRK